jgi:hypothetical protein
MTSMRAKFVGTYYDLDASQDDMIAFDASGDVHWVVPNESPQISTHGNHRAPFGKTRSHLKVFSQPVAQSVQPFGYFL